jgi:pimeloyl-ACP methyl ester carboxylesterase
MRLQASVIGEGPPVCLLHGLFGRGQNFGALARGLAGTRRVISLDLRNHGASPHARGMSYAAMADDVAESLDGLGIGACAVLGHSMGGKVAMMLALRSPLRVEGLVVADIAPVAYRHHNAGVAAAMRGLDLSPGLERREADTRLAEAVSDPAVRGFLLQNLSFGAAPAWKIGLAEIAGGMADIEGWPDVGPGVAYGGATLFIRGERSDYVDDAGWAAARVLFPRARLETVAGAGHWLHADRPADFGALVSGFLEEVRREKLPSAE